MKEEYKINVLDNFPERQYYFVDDLLCLKNLIEYSFFVNKVLENICRNE